MPVMDGYRATRRLRLLPGREETPVLALTAGVFRRISGRAALASGMNDFIAKHARCGAAHRDLAALSAGRCPAAHRERRTTPHEPVAGIDIDTGLRNWE